MNREKTLNFVKIFSIFLGSGLFLYSITNLSTQTYSWDFLLVLVLALFITPRLVLPLPHSRFTVSFSDALIFLSFLIYGGEAAVVLATLEILANCFYLQWKQTIKFGKLMLPVNGSLSAISTSATFFVWSLFPTLSDPQILSSDTKHLISALGILAITNFFVSSTLAAIFHSLKVQSNFWETWKKECFSSSMTYIVGAGIAGIIFKLINYGDFVTTSIAFFALGIAYLSYRQSINEISEAINQAEKAERAKADSEKTRRVETEKYAEELGISLNKEEKANEALRRSQKAFRHAAMHDSLTNLANRQNFSDVLQNLINNYKDDPSISFHVLFIDIRRFKNINDSLGHTIGDKVLMIVAKRFLRLLRPTDVVARLGGDEFAIILRGLSAMSKALKIARKIHQSIAQPFSLSGNRIYININVGIAPSDVEYDTSEEILRDADIAMHYAKEKNTGIAIFTKELRSRFLEKVQLETDLRYAIERKELSMHYQPLISLDEGRIIGFEALLRWHHSERGFIPPIKFIPIAEDSGLIVPITIWILQETCGQLAKWQQISHEFNDLIMSVNISGKHLANDELLDDVEQALEISGLTAEHLKLEITESVAMENAEHTIDVLTKLKKLGVQLSIDDFGTGYSSLSYLHRLPFDTLKIDRSFVYSVGEHGENSEILQTIISLAKNLRMKVIAEGIETESQYALLRNLGCDFGQGYLMAKPQPKAEAEIMLYEKRNFLPEGLSDTQDFTDESDEKQLHIF